MRLRTMTLLAAMPFVLVGVVITALLAVTGTGNPTGGRPSAIIPVHPAATVSRSAGPAAIAPAPQPATSPVSPQDQLHQDFNMTQYMSQPYASGGMFTGQVTDPQLVHSAEPGFVRALEQHQAEINRMLARDQ